MADLSQVQTRITRQGIPTRNRDSIIEPRRNTEAPQRRIFSDVRNAARGDNGAGQLMEALGLVQKAAGDLQGASQAKYDKREEELGSQGLFDEAAGHSDPELLRKSKAYRGSVMTQRAQTAFYQNAESLDDEVKQIINSDDPKLLDPAVRAQAIEQAINANFSNFLKDPETNKLRDWGSPQAAKWLGQQLGAARAEVRAKALQQVEERSNEVSIEQAGAAFGASIDAGKPLSFEDAMSTLLPTADKRKAKAQLILVAKDKAATLAEKAAELDETDPAEANRLRVQSLNLIDGIRGSKRTEQKPYYEGGPQKVGETPAGEPIVTAQAPAGALLDKHYAALEYIESRGNQAAVSPKGAVGVMQVMPGTGPEAAKLAGLPWDAKRFKNDADYNRKLGQAYYRKQLSEFGDPLKAAAAYNAGPGRVRGLISKYGDNWQAHLPAETKKYVKDFSEKLGSEATKAYPTGPAVDGNILNPASPADIAAADPVGASNPLYSLNPEERADLGAFRRQLKADIERADDAATTKRQSTQAMDYMARLHGMGAYPTAREIQSATRKGDISVAHAVQLLGVIEQDQNKVESEAREVRAETRADRAEQRENRVQIVDGHVNAILGNLLSGKYRRGADDAEAALRTLLPTIADSDVRQAVFSGVMQGVKAHTDLRNATPEYRKGMGQFDEWEAVYLQQLKGRNIAKGDRGRAEVLVKQWVNEYRVRLGEYAALPPDKVQAFMERAEKNLDWEIDKRFPPRGASARPNSSTAQRTVGK